MSLDPSPLSASPTPLLNPTDPVPGRGSALWGALISVALAIVIAIVSSRFGTQLVFLAQGLNVRTNVADAANIAHVQGFSLYWTKSMGSANGGYDDATPVATVLKDEAQNYHMNLAVITVTADMQGTSTATVQYAATDRDTYSDQTYEDAAAAATAAGLIPVFELEIRVQGDANGNYLSNIIGESWSNYNDRGTMKLEQRWYDSYAAYADHYAALAEQLHMPALIIGHNLPFLTTDSVTTAFKKPTVYWAHENACGGRHECGWRHIINTLTCQGTYTTSQNKTGTCANYTGKLIYAATSQVDNSGLTLSFPEWQGIKWWDAIDVIGVDAFIPLTANGQDVSKDVLKDAWHGKKDSYALANNGIGDVVSALGALFVQYQKPILFTDAGYESYSGSNTIPGRGSGGAQDVQDGNEQLYDMQALYETFEPEPWWLGVIWSADYPVWPRSGLSGDGQFGQFFEQDWPTNTEWGGDCAQDTQPPCANPEKDAGRWLRQTYKVVKLDPSSW